jgi:hypothetical protein
MRRNLCRRRRPTAQVRESPGAHVPDDIHGIFRRPLHELAHFAPRDGAGVHFANTQQRGATMTQMPIGRRNFLAATGATALAATVAGSAQATVGGVQMEDADKIEGVGPISIPDGSVQTAGVRLDTTARKPVYLPADPRSLVASAVAESLFWSDIMMEHALFFALLMPGDRLAAQRSAALRFQEAFAKQFLYARDKLWTESNVATLCRATIEQLRPFREFKLTMQASQERGELKSLVWPLFFHHTAHEAERAIERLTELAGGKPTLRFSEVASFWTEIMAEHLDFVAHLLDPQERKLVERAFSMGRRAYGAHAGVASLSQVDAGSLAADVIDFKQAAEQGIETGAIKSIIDPSLADHVLREAIRFKFEVANTQ